MADFGISLAVGLGLQLFSALLTPPTEGPRLTSKRVPRSDYGVDLARVEGIYPIVGQIIWSPKEYREERRKRGKIGGKSIEYLYYGDFAYAFLAGTMVGLLRLKLNGETKINNFSDDASTLNDGAEFLDKYCEIYTGGETQSPNATMQSVDGAANVPAYRGLSYLFLRDYPLTDSGNRPPNVEAIVCTNGTAAGQTYLVGRFAPVIWQSSNATLSNAPIDPLLGRCSFASGTNVQATTTEQLDLAMADGGLEIQFIAQGTGTYGLYPSAGAFGANPLSFEIGANLRVVENGVERWAASPTNAYPAGVRLGISFSGGQIRYWVNGTQVYSRTYTSTALLRGFANILTGTVGALITTGTATTSDRLTPTPVNLRTLLTKICAAGGVTSLDLTDIPSGAQILGINLAASGSPKDWLQQLQQIYFFDCFQRAGTLVFRQAAKGVPTRSLTLEALAVSELNSGRPEPYTIKAPNPSELPGEVSVKYYDGRDSNLRQKTVYSRIDTAPTRQKSLLTIDAVLTKQQAQAIADTEIKRRWYAKTIQFNLSLDHADLEPGDVVEMPFLGGNRRVMLVKKTLGANLLFDCEGVTQDDSIYETLVMAPTFNIAGTLHGGVFQRNYLAVLKIPKIRESDPNTLIYFGVGGQKNWVTAFLNVSRDGNDWDVLAQTNANSTLGIANSVLPNAAAGLDTTNSVIVQLHSNELQTITTDTFNAGGVTNLLLLGNEILRFRTAELIGEKTYRLSYLDRRRNATLGTGHVINEQVALLSTVQPVALEPDQTGAYQLKVTFDQQTLSEAVSISFNF